LIPSNPKLYPNSLILNFLNNLMFSLWTACIPQVENCCPGWSTWTFNFVFSLHLWFKGM
jgi:hypothetical protein